MKVYVVTSGMYSEYHIDAIFTDSVIAQQYANLDSDREIEEWETDIESVNPDPNKLVYHVTYDFKNNKIKTLCLTAGHSRGKDFVYNYGTIFCFYVSPSETLDNSIRMFGHNSDWLLKIAQDRFYMYCDANETSWQELIQKNDARKDKFSKTYSMYSTSIATSSMEISTGQDFFNPYFHADSRMTEIMKDYQKEHGAFPDAVTLKKIYDGQIEEVKAEHEQDE